MINPLNLHTDIFNSIFQNITGAFPNNIAANRAVADSTRNSGDSSADVNTVSFSEALAQRLTDSVNQDEYNIRRVINEELASAIDRSGGSDLLAMLIHQGSDSESLLNTLSLYSTMMRGLNRVNFNPLASMAMSQGSTLPFTSATSALIGMSNPFDALRMYGSMLGSQRTSPFNAQRN